ncbi:hypothetical protein [Actinomadura verrucosospora]|uniref:Uncharacterized protein n=1 Tax=Actinomadura verrucosospora TaxID=46165 RepID=A0A7D3VYE0_ACTVE|nr:hypothetical protein [Actinomadura verrucosospora]QKG25459.1 hypothetical protein ACTIVE_7111 [Actinomadura verrucosospora]
MTLGELSSRLSAALGPAGKGARTGADGLRAALAPFAAPRATRRLLCAALRDERWMAEMLAASYRHPNGFDKIVLLADAGCQLRLHVWRDDACETRVENVHNHRWDFSSVLLLGGYRFQEFVPDPDGPDFHTYGYASERGAAEYSLEPLGPRGLTCSFDAHLGPGTSYTLASDVLHRVSNVPGRLTVSLVLQGPHQAGTSVLVFAEDRLEAGEELHRAGFSRGSLRRLLEQLVDELAIPQPN